jgi:hypothetical protein
MPCLAFYCLFLSKLLLVLVWISWIQITSGKIKHFLFLGKRVCYTSQTSYIYIFAKWLCEIFFWITLHPLEYLVSSEYNFAVHNLGVVLLRILILMVLGSAKMFSHGYTEIKPLFLRAWNQSPFDQIPFVARTLSLSPSVSISDCWGGFYFFMSLFFPFSNVLQ